MPLSNRKVKVLECLLTSKTITEASKKANISDRTIRKYMKDQEFLEEYRKQCENVFREAVGESQKALKMAVHTLREIVDNPKENGNTKIRAIQVLIDLAYKGELSEIEKRITQLENVGTEDKLDQWDEENGWN